MLLTHLSSAKRIQALDTINTALEKHWKSINAQSSSTILAIQQTEYVFLYTLLSLVTTDKERSWVRTRPTKRRLSVLELGDWREEVIKKLIKVPVTDSHTYQVQIRAMLQHVYNLHMEK